MKALFLCCNCLPLAEAQRTAARLIYLNAHEITLFLVRSRHGWTLANDDVSPTPTRMQNKTRTQYVFCETGSSSLHLQWRLSQLLSEPQCHSYRTRGMKRGKSDAGDHDVHDIKTHVLESTSTIHRCAMVFFFFMKAHSSSQLNGLRSDLVQPSMSGAHDVRHGAAHSKGGRLPKSCRPERSSRHQRLITPE